MNAVTTSFSDTLSATLGEAQRADGIGAGACLFLVGVAVAVVVRVGVVADAVFMALIGLCRVRSCLSSRAGIA